MIEYNERLINMKQLTALVAVFMMIIPLMFAVCVAKTPQPAKITTDFSTIGFDLMKKELNEVNKNVLKTLGKPEKKSKPQTWAADGLEHQTWDYKTKGISLDMVKENNKQTVSSVKVYSPAKFKTQNNIVIGSSKSEVLKAYKGKLNPEESDLKKINNNDPSEFSVTAGTCYGGIILTFKNNRVSKIFIGAAAE